ncbi:MAG TPA: hypothetical protein VN310_17005 [Candidatus Dormibacteraeota bacterium]|nr:hypothetical protein [Candidatus Dormibacteraeota bacterium]
MTSTLAVLLQNDGSSAVGAVFSGMAMLFWLAVLVVVVIGGGKYLRKRVTPAGPS